MPNMCFTIDESKLFSWILNLTSKKKLSSICGLVCLTEKWKNENQNSKDIA